MSIIYFIQRGSGPIKIGFTASLDSRLTALRTFSDQPLTVLATVSGSKRAEKHFHSALAQHRLSGEWFAPHPDVLATAERVSAFGAECLPAGCAPRTKPRDVERQRNAEISVVCRAYIEGIGFPRRHSESIQRALERVSLVTGLSVRLLKSIWYGERTAVSAFAMMTLRKHFVLRFKRLAAAGGADA